MTARFTTLTGGAGPPQPTGRAISTTTNWQGGAAKPTGGAISATPTVLLSFSGHFPFDRWLFSFLSTVSWYILHNFGVIKEKREIREQTSARQLHSETKLLTLSSAIGMSNVGGRRSDKLAVIAQSWHRGQINCVREVEGRTGFTHSSPNSKVCDLLWGRQLSLASFSRKHRWGADSATSRAWQWPFGELFLYNSCDIFKH